MQSGEHREPAEHCHQRAADSNSTGPILEELESSVTDCAYKSAHAQARVKHYEVQNTMIASSGGEGLPTF